MNLSLQLLLQLYISSQCCTPLRLRHKATRFAKIPVLVTTIEDGDGPLKDSRFRSPQKWIDMSPGVHKDIPSCVASRETSKGSVFFGY